MHYKLEKTEDGARWIKQVFNSETEKVEEEQLPLNEPLVLDPNDFVERSSVFLFKERVMLKTSKPFEELLEELKELPVKKFEPFAFYNKIGDFIDIYWDEDAHYVEHLKNGVEIKRSFEDKSKVVGAYVWGIKRILLEAYANADKPEVFVTLKAMDPQKEGSDEEKTKS